jgi:hypothetical protein
MASGDGSAPTRDGPDLMVGSALITSFLIELGMPETVNVYYLKRGDWPIANLNGRRGPLVASKQRLRRYVEKLTEG